MNLNSKKVKLINLIINTDRQKILRKLEEVFENELCLQWFEDGLQGDCRTISKGDKESNKSEFIT